MRTIMVIFCLFSFSLCLSQKLPESSSRIWSEAKGFRVNGTLYSNIVSVSFKGPVVDAPQSSLTGTIRDVSEKFPSVRRLLQDVNARFGTFSLEKRVKSAWWGDTLRVNSKTGEKIRVEDLSQLFKLRFDGPVAIDSVIDLLRQEPQVRYASGPITPLMCTDPNDPLYTSGSEWHLDKIRAANAWSVTTGSPSIRIAVVDEGTYTAHEDLASKVVGGDGASGEHGTWVAGVAAAATNNDRGVASLGWQLSLLTYSWDATDWYEALARARDSAEVINMSWVVIRPAYLWEMPPECGDPEKWVAHCVMPAYDEVVAGILASANSLGRVCVAGAGNGSVNEGSVPDNCDPAPFPYEPCPGNLAGVLAVSATTIDGIPEEQVVDRYNYDQTTGGHWLDFAAPGDQIMTTAQNGGYQSPAGTSFATPQVSALAGLCKTIDPSLNGAQITSIIASTAEKIDAARFPYDANGWNGRLGYGRINAYQALLRTLALLNKSQSSQATGFNGQRKLHRDSSGKLHEVFASGTVTGGEVFYRNSADSGTTWSNTKRLSDGAATSLAPCITVGPGATPPVIVVWQQTNGSNYNVLYRRSTDGGSTWGSITPLESNFACASPGPLPSVSFNPQYGFVLVTYRSSLGLRWAKSTDNGTSWTAPAASPYNSAAYNSPTMGWYPIPYSLGSLCNLAFATTAGTPSQIYYGYFTNRSSVWSAAISLSGVLGANYQLHVNPTLAVSTTSTTTAHVAWEAETVSPPGPVLVYRKGTSGNFGSQYTVFVRFAYKPSLTGLSDDNAYMLYQNSYSGGGISKMQYSYSGGSWQWGSPSIVSATGFCPQLSVGSSSAKYLWTDGTSSPYSVTLGTDLLGKAGFLALEYSRELNLIDTTTGSSVTLEMKQLQLVHKDGTTTPVAFVNPPPDSVLIGLSEIWSYGRTAPFVLGASTDTLKLQYAIRTINSAEVLSAEVNAALSFTLREGKGGNPLSIFATHTVAKTADTTNALYEIALVPGTIPNVATGTELAIELVFSGLKEQGPDLIASLGHIYRLGGEGAVELPKDLVAEERGPKAYLLEQNYPNPFNPSTTLRFGLPEPAHVSLAIYNTLGQKVADVAEGDMTPGYHEVKWEARGLASGIYFARMTVTGNLGQILTSQTAKIVFMK